MKNLISTLRLCILCAAVIFFSTSLSAQECNIVYVTPGGASSGVAGTRALPASLSYGMSLVSAGANQVWMATGTYPISNTLVIPSNVTLEGGFNAISWTKSNSAQTVISKDTANSLPAPFNALVGLAGSSISNFRLQDITIQVANAPRHQLSVYGIYLSGCSSYNITRCSINTGSGSNGFDGIQGIAGMPGDTGTRGQPGNPNETLMGGGAGGTGAGGNNGGGGANNGYWDGTRNTPGATGLPLTCGGGGGASGSGPACSLGCAFGNPSCGSETPGAAGTAGGSGTAGTSGGPGAPGAITGGYFVPGATGGAGTSGTSGCGGGGGGGGGGRQNNGPDDVGGSGGGGGGAGGGGTSGSGSSGGGSSFAVFLLNNGAAGVIQDCALNPGAAGAGGVAGSGGTGGAGGAGGAGGLAGPCSNSFGGSGGNGGSGGTGGSGGSGMAGLSIALSENGGTSVSNMGIAAVPGNPPVISVSFRGCTNSQVVFSSTSSGAWNFGPGAIPATATGTGPYSVFYSTLGRKTIAFSGTNFTDYLNIFQTGTVGSGITPSSPTVTLGCPNSFSTATSGSSYEWIFGSAANPDTVQGAGSQSVSNIYFLTAGVHTIYVYVTTACCGKILDSTTVTVVPNASNVTLTASPLVLCQGSPVTFTASPSTYAGYVFYVNGTSAQNGTSNIYTTTTLIAGDSIRVIALAGTCFTNPSAVIRPTVNPVPAVTLSSSATGNTICAGQSVTFTASPAGYANYQFYNGATSVQNGASNTYATSTLSAGNSITVIGTNGCASPPSAAIITTVNPVPVMTLASSAIGNKICAGGSITFTATPAGAANYQFFNGASSVQTGAGNTWTTAALTAGNSITVIATSSAGCLGPASAPLVIVVTPIPSAVLSGTPAQICAGQSVTLTSAPAGYTNYAFYNGAVLVQTGAGNTYTTSGLIAGNNITVVAVNSGCSSPASNAVITVVNPSPVITATSVNSSCGNSNGSATATVTNGSSPFVYSWNNGQTTQTATSLAAGTYTVMVTNAAGCMQTVNVIVQNNNMPVLTLSSQSNVLCNGAATGIATVALTGGTAPFTYSWNTTPVQTSLNASGLAAGSYTLSVIDGNGCLQTQTVSITQPSALTTAVTSIPACGLSNGHAVTTASGGTGAFTYSWSPSGGTAATASALTTGFYTCSITDANGCINTNIVHVVADSIPLANAGPAVTIDYGNSTTLTGTGGGSYSWSPATALSCTTCPAPDASPLSTTTYTLTVQSDSGCIAQAMVTVSVDYKCSEIFVPSAFSPNGDGVNDEECVYGKCIQTLYFVVYDRWGEKVFEATSPDQCWDGIYKGEFLNMAVFAYYLKATLINGDVINKKGNINLVK